MVKTNAIVERLAAQKACHEVFIRAPAGYPRSSFGYFSFSIIHQMLSTDARGGYTNTASVHLAAESKPGGYCGQAGLQSPIKAFGDCRDGSARCPLDSYGIPAQVRLLVPGKLRVDPEKCCSHQRSSSEMPVYRLLL